jgi:hypothetical protein
MAMGCILIALLSFLAGFYEINLLFPLNSILSLGGIIGYMFLFSALGVASMKISDKILGRE